MTINAAEKWFGKAFSRLHPDLQQLHRYGGELKGEVSLLFGPGVAGFIGRRLARSLKMPVKSGLYPFTVAIAHDDDVLKWGRSWGGQLMESHFQPKGVFPSGHWIERTGLVTLHLGVDVVRGAWHWRKKNTYLWRIPMPKFLQPTMLAEKTVEGNGYHFSVVCRWGALGELFRYSGVLAYKACSVKQ